MATLVAIWSEVTTSRPRPCTRAIQVSTWTATVILLFALTSFTPPYCNNNSYSRAFRGYGWFFCQDPVHEVAPGQVCGDAEGQGACRVVIKFRGRAACGDSRETIRP
ncbi:hypothetical protein GCM10010339_55180 [Streptomyces alanosinicus]|uniref:Uncharacterized protein n=1 Tax=Streptomyces alanosinicus TaxID=68171 RepID=A0A919D663_9ACTN|nr:hypothetical protein GCM10010339_55180 [Streptomyces alanosinicus]